MFRLAAAQALSLAALAGASPESKPCPVPDGQAVASIEFQGLRHTRPGVVHAALGHKPGSSFSCRVWEEERNRLKDLDIFAEVVLETKPTGDSAALVYRFRELPPYVPLVTVNKTDQDGLSVGPALASLNFLGTALRVEAMARFGGTTEYQASVSGRQLFGRPVEFDAAWIHVDSYNRFEKFHENSHRFKLEGYWPLAWGLGPTGLAEFFRIESDTAGVTLRADGDFVPRLGAGLRLDRRDRALLPRRGYFLEGRFTQNGGALGGPADFWEGMFDGRGYLPFAVRHGTAAGVLMRYRNYGAIGEYDFLHSGGSNTLRGYPENSLRSPGEVSLNAEYRFDLLREKVQRLGPWSVHFALQIVAGGDAVGELWRDYSSIPFETGYYAGLHVLVPGLERIRLEVGSPVEEPDFRIHLGLFEKTTAQRFRTR